jgi:hypothetical protein
MTSPPEEAPEFRADIDAVSPKPILIPSPTNIPILEKSMDPGFSDQLDKSGEDLSAFQPPAEHAAESGASSLPHDAQAGAESKPEAYEFAHLNGNGDGSAQALAVESLGTVDNSAAPTSTNAAFDTSNPVVSTTSEDATEASKSQHPTMTVATQPLAQDQIVADPNSSAGLNSALPGVDIQALLQNLASTPTTITNATPAAEQVPDAKAPSSNAASPTNAFVGSSSLPPRPPPQEAAPGTALSPSEDIRSYHKLPSVYSRAPTGLPSLLNTAAANGLPPPPGMPLHQTALSATQLSPSEQIYRQRDALERPNDDEDKPWGPEVQAQFDDFLAAERQYVTDGQWDQFPLNSRLFIGTIERGS